jgi:hypothetical protein
MAMLIWVWDRVLISGAIWDCYQRFFSSLLSSLLPNNHPSSESTNAVSLEIVHSSFHQPPASSCLRESLDGVVDEEIAVD